MSAAAPAAASDDRSADGTVLLSAQALSKRFRGLVALHDVSFELRQGEILGLIGPNGAGKTTLVGLISGTITPTSGTLAFAGKPLNDLPSYRRAHLGIGRTFQIMKPFPGLSVLENVAVGALFGNGGGLRSRRAARERALHWLEFCGLKPFADHRADTLNGPGRKRLELAKALAMQPRLLLLDEVMAGLNPSEVNEVIELIRSIRSSGVTILVIEHVIKAIQSLSDRLLVLHHGELIAAGSPQTVLADPLVIEAYLGKRRT